VKGKNNVFAFEYELRLIKVCWKHYLNGNGKN